MTETHDRRRVRIVEVGPRDGLQNEDGVGAGRGEGGVRRGARRRRAPGRRGDVVREPTRRAAARRRRRGAAPRVRRRPGVRYPVLVPNMRGMERAERAGADAVAVFTAASEAFNERNIGMSIEGSLEAFAPVLERARELGWWRRGYVSTAFGCPYSGAVDTARVAEVSAARCSSSGATRSRVGDTIGVATPDDVRRVVRRAARAHPGRPARAPPARHAGPGARQRARPASSAACATFDASAGGTGGCPFAPGAPGNLATESLCALLDRLGIEHGVDAPAVGVAAAVALREFTRDVVHTGVTVAVQPRLPWRHGCSPPKPSTSCARSRSGASGSSGCGSPTCSAS